MLPCQASPVSYVGRSCQPEHWLYNQNQQILNPQIIAATANNRTNYTTWCSPQEMPKPFVAANNLHTPLPQRNPAHYRPHANESVNYPGPKTPKPYQNNSTMGKRHHAMISFVPTKTGNFRAIVKRKRKRTMFTTEQVEALENIFKRKQYVTREEREAIVDQLQINDKAVKVWFQNRRLKDKRGLDEAEEEEIIQPSFIRHSPNPAILDEVQSKINENTNELGFVTLDDGLMRDLFSVIDEVLTTNTSNVRVYNVTELHSDFIDESSSSDGFSYNREVHPNWHPESKESLESHFDLKTIFSS